MISERLYADQLLCEACILLLPRMVLTIARASHKKQCPPSLISIHSCHNIVMTFHVTMKTKIKLILICI